MGGEEGGERMGDRGGRKGRGEEGRGGEGGGVRKQNNTASPAQTHTSKRVLHSVKHTHT